MTATTHAPRQGVSLHVPRIPQTAAWGITLAVGTAVISGVSVWVNSFGVRAVPDAAVYTTLKNGVAAAILIGALMLIRPTGGQRLTSGQWGRLLVIGVVGGSIPFLLFFTGLAEATAPGAAFIHKTLFIWVALLAVVFLGERLGVVSIVAMAALLGGQLLLAPPNVDGAGWGTGETLIAAATLMWSVEVVLAKRLLGSVPPLVVGAGRLGIGLVLLVGFLAVTDKLGAVVALGAEGWGWALLTGLLLAGYVATWMSALQRAPASAVTAVLVLGAVITTLLQALYAGTMPAPTAILGAVVLAVAVAVVGIMGAQGARAASRERVVVEA